MANSPIRSRYEALAKKENPSEFEIDDLFRAAEKQKSAEPENLDVLVWWAASAGLYAKYHKNLGSLRLIKRVEKELVHAQTAHPCYGNGSIEIALQHLYEGAPRIISIGSKTKAEKFRLLAEKCHSTR